MQKFKEANCRTLNMQATLVKMKLFKFKQVA